MIYTIKFSGHVCRIHFLELLAHNPSLIMVRYNYERMSIIIFVSIVNKHQSINDMIFSQTIITAKFEVYLMGNLHELLIVFVIA